MGFHAPGEAARILATSIDLARQGQLALHGWLVVVVLAIVAYFVFAGGGLGGGEKDVNVDVDLPEVSAPSVPAPAEG